MLLMALTIPLSFLEKEGLKLHLLGVTYHFTHEGNPAYVWTCYEQFKDTLCVELAALKDTCNDYYSFKIAGFIFLGLTSLVFLVQLIDLLQVLLIRSRIFSATTKVDVYELSPVIYALAIVIYGFITGAYKGNYGLGWGLLVAFGCQIVLVLFALLAKVLESAAEPQSSGHEPLLPVKDPEAREVQS